MSHITRRLLSLSHAMPNPTFFNLPEKKRQKITELAIAEFANADYDNASISNIVKQAKIAKGSFYQYFEDKKDLYLYLVDSASQRRMAFIESAQKAEKKEKKRDFFRELRWLFDITTQFALQHPLLNQIINRAAYGDSPLKKDVFKHLQAAFKQPIYDLVQQGIANGDLRSDLDPDLATFIVLAAGESLRDFIPEKLALDTEKLAGSAELDLDIQSVERIYDQLIQVLERGMGSNNP